MRNVIRACNETLFKTNKGAPFEAGGSNRDVPLGFYGGTPSCRVVAALA
jgi:hypothetical protein